jgi:outer membrane lipoprotein carrier protein
VSWLFLLGLFFLAETAVGPVTADEVVRVLESHYNRLDSLKAEFVQIYRSDEQAPPRQEAGTLYLKKPGRMRWEYAQPEVKLFLSDGKTIFFYVPQDRQVIRVPVKESADLRTPLRFLLGRMNLKREFRVELAQNAAPLDPGNPVLRLLPKRNDERFRELLLEMDGRERIRRLKILESNGAITEFRLFGEIPNPRLDNALFQFRPPPGVEVVDENSSQKR